MRKIYFGEHYYPSVSSRYAAEIYTEVDEPTFKKIFTEVNLYEPVHETYEVFAGVFVADVNLPMLYVARGEIQVSLTYFDSTNRLFLPESLVNYAQIGFSPPLEIIGFLNGSPSDAIKRSMYSTFVPFPWSGTFTYNEMVGGYFGDEPFQFPIVFDLQPVYKQIGNVEFVGIIRPTFPTYLGRIYIDDYNYVDYHIWGGGPLWVKWNENPVCNLPGVTDTSGDKVYIAFLIPSTKYLMSLYAKELFIPDSDISVMLRDLPVGSYGFIGYSQYVPVNVRVYSNIYEDPKRIIGPYGGSVTLKLINPNDEVVCSWSSNFDYTL